MNTDMDNYIKLVMLGEGRVGKTSLTLRYCKGIFDDNQISTINASYLEKKITLSSGEQRNLAIWDTAGQEKFNAIAPMYYRDALGAIIVYDITFKESFDKVKKWITELRQFADSKIVVCIAGNKSDNENMRQIQKQMAEKYAEELDCFHFSTSAKTNMGVDELFKFLCDKIVEKSGKKKGGKGKKNRKNILNDKFDDQGNESPVESSNNNNNAYSNDNYNEQDSYSTQPQKQEKKSKKNQLQEDEQQYPDEPKNRKSHQLKNNKKPDKKKEGCC